MNVHARSINIPSRRALDGSAMSVMDAIYARRAIREYRPVKPDENTIRALLDAAVQAPTAMHGEPWCFAIIQDPALLKRDSDRAKELLLANHPEDTKTSSYATLLHAMFWFELPPAP